MFEASFILEKYMNISKKKKKFLSCEKIESSIFEKFADVINSRQTQTKQKIPNRTAIPMETRRKGKKSSTLNQFKMHSFIFKMLYSISSYISVPHFLKNNSSSGQNNVN